MTRKRKIIESIINNGIVIIKLQLPSLELISRKRSKKKINTPPIKSQKSLNRPKKASIKGTNPSDIDTKENSIQAYGNCPAYSINHYK